MAMKKNRKAIKRNSINTFIPGLVAEINGNKVKSIPRTRAPELYSKPILMSILQWIEVSIIDRGKLVNPFGWP